MNIRKFMLYALVFGVLSFGTSAVYGQSTDPQSEISYIGHAITGLTFVAAGVFYATSGYIKKIRKKLSGDNSVKLDYSKMGKTTIIGVVLGIGAFIMSTYNGDIIHVANMHEFFVQVGLNMSAILIIDKWILGRSEGPTKPTI